MRDSTPTWQKILSQGFSSATELLQFLQLPTNEGSALAEQQFKTRVPRGFVSRMQPKNRQDPLLLQVLATDEELLPTQDFTTDPLQETSTNPVPGLIHKYHGRVLITLTGACAINCRYCFRRHFPYHENNQGRPGWLPILEYINNDKAIHEVILSGGDPLLINDQVLTELFDLLASVPHLRTIRFHTRVPIVLPERVTHELIQLLMTKRFQVVVVLHCNHPHELSQDVALACQALRQAGCHLLNQSVLLAGVNDHVDILVALSERLFAFGVLPYYLHLLDKVQGSAHFQIDGALISTLFQKLQSRLPGYLVPRLAREEPGEKNKTLII